MLPQVWTRLCAISDLKLQRIVCTSEGRTSLVCENRGTAFQAVIVEPLAPRAGHHGQGCPCHYGMLTFLPE